METIERKDPLSWWEASKSSIKHLCNDLLDDINVWSGWIIESIDAEYSNISIYSPLSGSSCIELPVKLRNSMKFD